MKKYPKYKDSGVEWIGEIPDKWKLVKLKFLSILSGGSTPKTDNLHYWNGNISWITPNDLGKLKTKLILDSEKKITIEGLNSCSASIAPVNSIILSTRAPIGHIGLLAIKAATNQGCKTIIPLTNKVHSDFIYYYLIAAREDLKNKGSGSTFMELSTQSLKDYIIVLSSLVEQKLIASFLDHKTSEIDQLIAAKEKLIEKLEARRKAIINEAVTGQAYKTGLLQPPQGKTLKFKDSGIEWLGEIPEWWEVKKLKYLLNEKDGIRIGPFGSSLRLDFMIDKGVKVYGQENIIKGDFTIGKRFIKDEKYYQMEQYTVIPGDILITMMGTTGKSKVCPDNIDIGIIDSHLIRIRVNKLVSNFFLSFIINDSSYIKNQINFKGKGAIMSGLNSKIIRSLDIILPPINEQERIIDFINEKLCVITQIDLTLKIQIEKLKKYKQSLITEAVTGKIDVRDWKPPTDMLTDNNNISQ